MSKRRVSGKTITFLALLLAVALGIGIGSLVSDRVLSAEQSSHVALLKAGSGGAPLEVDQEAASLSQGFARVAKSVEPAVVNISTTAVLRARTSQRIPEGGLREFFGDDFFERFFGRNAPSGEHKDTSLGSGVIVDPKGYILTNYHVIASVRSRSSERISGKIEVTLHNGETYVAHVLGEDPESDLSVLKIEAGHPLPRARVGDSSKMKVGDWVLAIGNPFGVGQTVTSGIVSATGRVVPTANIFGDYIQTDAAINPGNSGGPLVNLRGEVVGINTFILTRSGGSQGVGFSIPSSVFINSYNQIVTKGKIDRGWLGVSMNLFPMTPEMARYFGVAGNDPSGIKDGDGVLIVQLIDEKGDPGEGGPAYKAGVRPEDVIVKFGDREIEDTYDLRSAVANTPPGQSVPLTVVRKGKVLHLDVTLAERTLERATRKEESGEGLSFEERREKEKRQKEIGLEFETLKPQDAERMGLEGVEGVKILDVAVGSLADEAGLLRNQIITHVNGKAVRTAQDLYDTISGMPSGRGVVLRVVWVNPRDRQHRRQVAFVSFVKP